MGQYLDQYGKWKKAKAQLNSLNRDREHTLIVHYASESMYDRRERPESPRIGSIAVRNLDTGQTRSFSIHLVAEERGWLRDIDAHFDELEREVLAQFFEFVKQRLHSKWVHWNMRDVNFGFDALEHRLRVLQGTPAASVPEEKRVDLSILLIDLYGSEYIGHPRLEKLREKNGGMHRDFLTGEQQAEAFDSRNFFALHQSTLRKVESMGNFVNDAHAGILKTDASRWAASGRSFKALLEWTKSSWWFIAGGIASSFISKSWGWLSSIF